MQVLMGIGYNLSLRMSFMICRIKKRLKKIEDIMKKVMFINKTNGQQERTVVRTIKKSPKIVG